MLVHTGTTITSEFLVADDEGNIIDRRSVSGQVPRLDDATWAAALAEIRTHRDSITLPTVPAPVEAAVPTEEVPFGS